MTQTHGTVTYNADSALALTTKAQTALVNSDMVIDSLDMYELASEDLKAIKTLQKEVEEKRTSITGPLNQAVKAVNDLFRAPKEFLDKAEAVLKRSMVTYQTEQERIAAESRRAAEAAARAERERLAAEERERQEAARKAQEAAQTAIAAGDEVAAAQAQAEAEAAEAEAAVLAMTAQVVTVAPEVEAPAKVAGISGRVSYSAEVISLVSLVQAVAEGKAPIECLQPDMKFLNAQARAFKKEGPLFYGVNVIAERTIAARSN